MDVKNYLIDKCSCIRVMRLQIKGFGIIIYAFRPSICADDGLCIILVVFVFEVTLKWYYVKVLVCIIHMHPTRVFLELNGP